MRKFDAIIMHRWSVAAVLFGLSIQTPRAQTPTPVNLGNVQSLKCTFTLQATGTWDNGVPGAEVTPANLSMQFDAIDTQDGTASVSNVSATGGGTPNVTVRLLGDNLHI